MNKKRTITALFMCLYLPQFQGCARMAGEGVDTLLEMKKDEGKTREILNREESDFQAMKTAVQKQRLKTGMSGREAERISAPVLIAREEKGWRWVYQGKGGGVFHGQKIYLFFDENDQLEKWECVRIEDRCEG